MYVLLDLQTRTAALEEAADTHRLLVNAVHSADRTLAEQVLTAEGAGHLDANDENGDHAWISVSWLREAAIRHAVSTSWEDHTAKLFERAAKHGDLSDDRQHIRVDIEWMAEHGLTD
ncbi:MAG: hypothetical protein MUF83_05550 [Acidimicrobiales bacterium]|jgi:hypothetical protein|nr:hypothetical protein [Acidimicrobiales bacterium]